MQNEKTTVEFIHKYIYITTLNSAIYISIMASNGINLSLSVEL